MFDLQSYLIGLIVVMSAAVASWVVSVIKRDVSIVDSMWSLMFLLAAPVYAVSLPAPGPRTELVLLLVTVWALRLFIHITWRNWGEQEDRRYQAIRANNEPYFAFKSLYIVFGLQALIAWVVSLPLLAAIASPADLGYVDLAAVLIWTVGMVFEAGGDYQLARFRSDPQNRDKVMDRGLWRYTRHPNYFGDACVWWGFGLFGITAGAWWVLLSPVLMTFLLLRVSGVSLLEQDIGERRPAYADYIVRTNAFLPAPPAKHRPGGQQSEGHN